MTRTNHQTKVAVLNLTHLPMPFDEVFSFGDGTGKFWHWNTSAINRAIVAKEIPATFVKAPIDKTIYDHVMNYGGTEAQKIKRLMDRPDIVAQPILIIEWPDGKSTIADGNHRLVIHYRLGMRHIGANVVKLADANKFNVPFPDELGPAFTAQ